MQKSRIQNQKQSYQNSKYQTFSEWTGTLTGTHDTNQSGLLNVWSVFSNLRKGSVNVQIWDVFIWHDWFCWVSSSQSNPPGSPFTPRKQLGPDPCSAGQPSSFQPWLPGTLPWFLPLAPSHSAAEITLFILCIIVSSWMQKLCRHSSELS